MIKKDKDLFNLEQSVFKAVNLEKLKKCTKIHTRLNTLLNKVCVSVRISIWHVHSPVSLLCVVLVRSLFRAGSVPTEAHEKVEERLKEESNPGCMTEMFKKQVLIACFHEICTLTWPTVRSCIGGCVFFFFQLFLPSYSYLYINIFESKCFMGVFCLYKEKLKLF